MGKSQTFYKKPNFKYVLPQKCINSVNIDFVKQPYTQPTSVLFLFFFFWFCVFSDVMIVYDMFTRDFTNCTCLHLSTPIFTGMR